MKKKTNQKHYRKKTKKIYSSYKRTQGRPENDQRLVD
jgi:hypothetical protein